MLYTFYVNTFLHAPAHPLHTFMFPRAEDLVSTVQSYYVRQDNGKNIPDETLPY